MNRRTAIVCLLALTVAGCDAAPDTEQPAIQPHNRKEILAILFDTSGSFYSLMFGNDARAYRFCAASADRFFRDKLGDESSIVLAQLSANDRPLLWEGSPVELRQKFPDPEAMRRFVQGLSDPNGSRLYGGLADTLGYINDLPGVSTGETRVCVLVVSDMEDNAPTQEEDRKRLVESLRRFGKAKSCMGFYYVSPQELSRCRQIVQEAGTMAIVESGIVETPKLPTFDQ